MKIVESLSPAKMVVEEFWNARETALSKYTGDYDVDIVDVDETTVELVSISSYNRGNGVGNAVMVALLTIAQKHGVSVILEVGPQYDTKGTGEVLDGQQLTDWYSRFGFEWDSHGMIWRPDSA